MVDRNRHSMQHSDAPGASRPEAAGAAIYTIHYNGDRPFRVTIHADVASDQFVVTDCAITIAKLNYVRDDESWMETSETIMHGTVRSIWIGRDEKSTEFVNRYLHGDQYDPIHGNTMLIEMLPGEYVFICDEMYSFSIPDPVEMFVSPIYCSDVPYPYIVAGNRVYLLVARVSIAKTAATDCDHPDIMRRNDPYGAYYASRNADMGVESIEMRGATPI